MTDENETLYSVTQVAKLFQVSPETVRTWIKNGSLRAIKMGHWRVPQSAIKEKIEANSPPTGIEELL